MGIIIKNLNYQIQNNIIFNNLNLKIKEGTWLNIVGKKSSGKTSLAKILIGNIICPKQIFIDEIELSASTIDETRLKIGYICENINNTFINNTVYQEIIYMLENINISKKEIDKLVTKYIDLFNIKYLVNKNINTLSGGEKYKVSLISNLIHNPKYLIIDTDLSMIDNNTRKEIYDILIKLNKENNLTIINFYNDIDNLIINGRTIILDKNNIIIDTETINIYNLEQELNILNYQLPFEINLSYKLKLYNLLKEIFFDIEKMVNELWK